MIYNQPIHLLTYICVTLYYPHRSPAIVGLGISASKFISLPSGKHEASSLDSFLSSKPSTTMSSQGPATHTRPGVDLSQKQQESTKKGTSTTGSTVKRNSLEFFFSASQNVVRKDVSEEQDTDGREQQEAMTSDGAVGRHCESSLLSLPQAVSQDTTIHLEETTKMCLPLNGCDGVTMKKVNTAKPGGIRGFFASKMQEKSKETPEVSRTNCHDGNLLNEGSVSEKGSPDKDECKMIKKQACLESPVCNDDDDDIEECGIGASTSAAVAPFAQPSTFEQNHGNSCNDDVDQIPCEKCSQTISVWEYPEHLDYHFALDLQQNQSSQVVPVVDLSSSSSASSSAASSSTPGKQTTGKRRGRPPGSSSASKKPRLDASGGGGSATLHSFFKPK